MFQFAVIIMTLAGGCAANPPTKQVCGEFDPPWPAVRVVRVAADVKEVRPYTDSARSLADIANRVNGAVVRVRAVVSRPTRIIDAGGDVRATKTRLGGTGVMITNDGIILTNEHVIRNAENVTVTLADGNEYDVKRIARAPKLDLAALWIDIPTETVVTPGDSPADPGTPVVAISAARRETPRDIRTGIITRLTVSLQNELDSSRARYYDDLLECSAKLEPGYSGGPLLDVNGHLVGINVAALGEPGDEYARAYAIPLHRANRLVIDEMIERLHD